LFFLLLLALASCCACFKFLLLLVASCLPMAVRALLALCALAAWGASAPLSASSASSPSSPSSSSPSSSSSPLAAAFVHRRLVRVAGLSDSSPASSSSSSSAALVACLEAHDANALRVDLWASAAGSLDLWLRDPSPRNALSDAVLARCLPPRAVWASIPADKFLADALAERALLDHQRRQRAAQSLFVEPALDDQWYGKDLEPSTFTSSSAFFFFFFLN
jgi:hypothetical protein